MTRYLSFRYLISIDFFEIQAISEYCNFSELLIYFGLSVVSFGSIPQLTSIQ
mgnify:FL=1